MQAESWDATRAGSDITGFCGRPGQHSASPGAEQPDRHAGGPVRWGPQSSSPHHSTLLPGLSPPAPSPGPRSLPGSCWGPTAPAHVSVGGRVRQKRNKAVAFIRLGSLGMKWLRTRYGEGGREIKKVMVQTLASLSASREPPACSCRRA